MNLLLFLQKKKNHTREILQELIAIVSIRVGNYILQHDPIKFIEDHEKIKEMSAEGRQVIIRRDGSLSFL